MMGHVTSLYPAHRSPSLTQETQIKCFIKWYSPRSSLKKIQTIKKILRVLILDVIKLDELESMLLVCFIGEIDLNNSCYYML